MAKLRSGMGLVAECGAAGDSGAEASGEVAAASARASPPISEAALEIADQLLGLGEATPCTGSAEAAAGDAGSAGVRLLVEGQILDVPALGVVLGRQPGSSGVVIADACVSRRHVSVRRKGAEIVVTDLGSVNGTVVIRGEVMMHVDAEGTPAACGDRIMTANGVLLAEVVGESPGGPHP